MSAPFHVSDLSGDLIAQALPLVRATWPEAELASWRTFVSSFAGAPPEEAGMLALLEADRYICGLLAYRCGHDLRAGAILDVGFFTVVDLVNSRRAVKALLDAAMTRAAALSCAGVQIRLQQEQADLDVRLRHLGVSSNATLLWKPIDS